MDLMLVTYTGASKIVPVVAAYRDPRKLLIVRWGFRNYDYDILRDRLMGPKLTWRAKDRERALWVFDAIIARGRVSGSLL